MVDSSILQYTNRKKLVIKDLEYIIASKKQRENGSTIKNIATNFLQAIENSNRELDEMEEHIDMLLVAANRDRNILEECKNYIQQKYNQHLAIVNGVASSSEYEYCLELINNAKIRAGLVNNIPPSLDRITTNPHKMNGKPCIRDLRLTVWRVLELLQTYPDRSELFKEFPDLEQEDIKQALIYADLHPQESLKAPTATTTPISHETFA